MENKLVGEAYHRYQCNQHKCTSPNFINSFLLSELTICLQNHYSAPTVMAAEPLSWLSFTVKPKVNSIAGTPHI